MSAKDFAEVLELICREDRRYDKAAYHFLRQALDHTMSQQGGGRRKGGKGAHVSGRELLEGIRVFALEQYGPMARTLFEQWGVRRCEDFGEMVFTLVEYGVLGKTEEDSKADFANGFDFDEVFLKPFLPKGGIRDAAVPDCD